MTFREVLLQHSYESSCSDKTSQEACGRIALYTPDGLQLTYAQLMEQAEQMNHEFERLTDSKRQLIFILCHQNIATITAIVAILTGKHVAILIPDSIDKSQLEKLTESYQPNIIYHTDGKPMHKASSRRHDMHRELCLMLSTSGSTGTPKQVKLSQNNLFENARSITRYLNINEQERAITSLPLSYSYGLSVLTSHLFAGASLLVSDASVMTRTFWEQLDSFQVTSIAGVPYTYEMFHRLKLVEQPLPYLKTMTQAGGKLKKELVCEFSEYTKKTGKNFYVMYGQTEATARMAYLKPSEVLKYPESIGHAIPGGSFILIDDDKKPINQADIVGELVYSGPNVMMGYAIDYNDLAKISELDVLHTGDLAYRNSDGLFFITGRKSRFLKLYGLRVSLIDIENYLKDHGYEVACSGVDDLLTIVVLSNETNGLDTSVQIEHNVMKLVREQLNIHPHVIKIKVCSEIPLNANGKIDYAQVHEQVMAKFDMDEKI